MALRAASPLAQINGLRHHPHLCISTVSTSSVYPPFICRCSRFKESINSKVFGTNVASTTFSSPSRSATWEWHQNRHVWQCFQLSDGGSIDEKSVILNEQVLKTNLLAAIHLEDYEKAAMLRDQLKLLQEDNKTALLSANQEFYKAFENADMSLMQKIWSKKENVHCIHPGAGCISGYDLVIASWEVMLGVDASLCINIELHNVQVHVNGDLGFVTCLEVVRTSGNSWGKQLATNVFEKQNGSWKICVHHASHITP